MKKFVAVAALLASTAATPAFSQLTNLTIDTPLSGTFAINGNTQTFNGTALLRGSFDYSQIASASGTAFMNFVAPFTQTGQTGTQDFALGGNVNARYDNNTSTLLFTQGGSTLFSFAISNLLQTNGAPPTTATTLTNASSFTFNGGVVTINGGARGSLSAVVPAAAAVPEPATWGMMILGFGVVGAAMRRRAKVRTTVRYA